MKINDFCQYLEDSGPKNVSKYQQKMTKISEKLKNNKFLENYCKSNIIMSFYDDARHSLAARKRGGWDFQFWNFGICIGKDNMEQKKNAGNNVDFD